MNSTRKFGLSGTVILIIALAFMVAGCSDDDGTTTPPPGGDTTAPRVVSVMPSQGTVAVGVDDLITVQFSEAMDQATVDGQITLSSGTVTGLTWTSTTTVTVAHTGWAQGTKVTVTVGTGVKDLAGNAMNAPLPTVFWTMSDTLMVFESSPANGATGVDRSASIQLLFSAQMNVPTVAGGVTISDGTKATYPFTLDSQDEVRFLLNPENDLPANTEITVTIGTGVQSQQGQSPAEPIVSTFTTSDQIDSTPPTIVSLDPSNGSVIPVDQQTLTITFSEPVNPDNFKPTSMSGQLQWIIAQSPSEPVWNGTFEVLTVALPAEMPNGLAMDAVFADYEDLAGNVQTAETPWSVTVTGTGDPYPLEDGKRYTFIGEWAEGEGGSEEPTQTGVDFVFYQVVARQATNQWNIEEYFDPEYSVLDYYEIQSVTSDGVFFLGFAEEFDKAFTEIMLDTPAVWAEYPLVAGNTWTQDISVTLPDGTLDVGLEGEVFGPEDLHVGTIDGIDVTWRGAWRVRLGLSLSSGGPVSSTEERVFWYVPGVGLVRETNREDNFETGNERWSTHDRWLSLGFE